MDAILSGIAAAVESLWSVVRPHSLSTDRPLWSFAVGSLVAMARNYFWFLLVGMAIYAFFVRRSERFSPWTAVKFLLPASIYKTPSVRIDLMLVPVSWVLNFVLFAGLAVGSGVVQIWLVKQYGPSSLQIPAGATAIVLQILFTLLGTDVARFSWHYQGHKVPFFWEFHKGHHSAEALHPIFIRTHPVDMLIRLLYMNVGGGLVGGGLMYIAGVNASAAAAGFLALIGAAIHLMQQFEHSHVKFSFGKTLDKVFYPPHFHLIHHSALPEHRDKNLGLTGGLCLWDKLAGTLYIPKPDERIVYGASMEELGDDNPHRTLWGFLWRPFVEAVKTLRPRVGNVVGRQQS